MNWKALLGIAAILSLVIPIFPAYAAAPPNPDTFTYLTLGGPETGDGAWAYDTASATLIFNIYQCLCDFDFANLDSYVAEIADSWPGYGVNPGNAVTPSPPHPHEFTGTTLNVANPVGTTWTRKGVTYTLKAWEDTDANGYLDYCDQVVMTWMYNTTLSAYEDLDYHVEKVEVIAGGYKLTLTPKWIDQTWYFHINPNIPWQNPAYGYVTPYDVEYSFERGMAMDHAGGPQWMFFEPLTGTFGTRDGSWNIPKYRYWDPTAPDQTAMLGRWIDDAIESDATTGEIWFNLVMPYVPFQQILCQSWGSILDAEWTMALPADPVGGKNWNASWHVTPGLEGYLSWIVYNNPPTPGPLGFNMMGQGPYYLDYVDPLTGYWRIKKFANYWGGWTKPHCSTIIHEKVLEWATRKARFLTDDPATQADVIAIERANTEDPDLLAAIAACRVRYMANLPQLIADAIFFCYDYLALTPPPDYMHKLGGVDNRTLLSDRDLRLGLVYAYNATEYIQDVWLGEATELHDPVIYGIAYANATKHSLMHYKKNLAEAEAHLRAAWNGEVWSKGATIYIVYFPISDARRVPAEMIEYVVEYEIGAPINIVPVGLDWRPGLIQMYSGNLGCYIVGWLADYPHPHNWVFPFMHTHGDFSYFQCIDYGKPDITKMNWHPWGDYGIRVPGQTSYTNYKGDTITDVNNDYVDGLIETGIATADPAVAEKLYTELEDIFYAEVATLMTYQASGRRYERVWVQGWFYQSIYPGPMFYGEMNIWKQDPATVVRNLDVTNSAKQHPLTGRWEMDVEIHNKGITPELFFVQFKWWDSTGQPRYSPVIGILQLRPCNEIHITYPATGATQYGLAFKVTVWHTWVGCGTLYLWETKTCKWIVSKRSGDFGTGPPLKWFAFDNSVDAWDLTFWVLSYNCLAPQGMCLPSSPIDP